MSQTVAESGTGGTGRPEAVYFQIANATGGPTLRGMNKIVLIILAIFIPPLAVYLKTNSGKDTLINLVLCFLFWIPGVIHALWKVAM